MAAGCLSSCTGEWLDTVKEGVPAEGTFWKNDADYTKAVNTLYDCFSYEETWGRNLFYEHGACDDIVFGRSRGASQMNLAKLCMDGSTEGSLKDFYNQMYTTMSMANNVIYHALQYSCSETLPWRGLFYAWIHSLYDSLSLWSYR